MVPRKKQIAGLDLGENIIYIYEQKGTFDSNNLVEHYLNRVLKPYFCKNKIKNSLIVLDQAKCHLKKSFKDGLAELGCELEYIPSGLTGNYLIVLI